MEKQDKQAVIDHQLIQMVRRRLNEGEKVVVTVNGRSMLPLLKPNDKILLEHAQPNQLNQGDIITVDCASTLLTHRFWGYEHNAEQLLTRGDRQFTFDTPHTCNQLLGKVTLRQRGNLNFQQGPGRRLNDYLRWVFTISYKLETLLKKESDHTKTTTLHHFMSRLVRYWTIGSTTGVTKVVDLLLP
ncbi:MAG: hypothetical protein DWQ04_34965 [Chloroflexi bacterium]|nr:MAG: hypothetical protein DWQ04_34965 [Chloroflexota bacterium]